MDFLSLSSGPLAFNLAFYCFVNGLVELPPGAIMVLDWTMELMAMGGEKAEVLN